MDELSQISRTRSLLLVLIVSVSWYAALHWIMEYPVSPGHMFMALDAQEYWSVSKWIMGNGETNCTIIRPYLYPLLIGLSEMIGGIRGIWLLQVLAWLISILNVHRGVLHATRSRFWAWSASLLLMTNLSFFALTYHALTEVITICLLSCLSSHVLIRSGSWRSPGFHATNLLLLGLLSLMKPVFYPVLLIYLTVSLFLFWRWKMLSRRLLIFALALSPLIPQFMIMSIRHDHFGISTIGALTFKNYFFARGYAEINGTDVDHARQAISDYSSSEMRSYLIHHWRGYLDVYLKVLEENVYHSGGASVLMGLDTSRTQVALIMYGLNKVICILHLIVLLLFPWMVFIMKKRHVSIAWALIYFMILYLILTSGISFWQGDRLILPAIACWSLLYPIILHQTWFSLSNVSVLKSIRSS